ncbi:hypothetical protein ACRRTK_019644 [Alexandromys fortis]
MKDPFYSSKARVGLSKMACLKILALEGPYHQGKRIVYTVTLSTQKITDQ